MVFSHLVRAVVAGLVLSNLCMAQDSTRVDGFRSELWRMEYRDQDDNAEQNVSDAAETDESAQKQLQVSVKSRVSRDMVASAVADDSLEVSAPGLVDMQDLSNETPFADWKVDEGAAGSDSHRKFEAASAWQLSQAGNGDEVTVPLSNGPSMVTFMVAIVACVVVTGALFSGRE